MCNKMKMIKRLQIQETLLLMKMAYIGAKSRKLKMCIFILFMNYLTTLSVYNIRLLDDQRIVQGSDCVLI